jgi:hypothetical protein
MPGSELATKRDARPRRITIPQATQVKSIADDFNKCDDYRSRARVSKPALGQRRKTRSPSTSFSSPPPSSTPKPNSKKKKGEKQKETEQPENNDFIPDIEKDVILAKFFAAENAAFGMSDNERPQKGKPAGKAKKKIGKVGKKKVVPKEKPKPKEKGTEEKSVTARKRKSGTPRKLEVIEPAQMDTWENSEETEIVKNSANDADYIIKERK